MADNQNSPGGPRLRRVDTDLQFDPTLTEGRASPLRIAAYLIGGLAIVGFVLYGMVSN